MLSPRISRPTARLCAHTSGRAPSPRAGGPSAVSSPTSHLRHPALRPAFLSDSSSSTRARSPARPTRPRALDPLTLYPRKPHPNPALPYVPWSRHVSPACPGLEQLNLPSSRRHVRSEASPGRAASPSRAAPPTCQVKRAMEKSYQAAGISYEEWKKCKVARASAGPEHPSRCAGGTFGGSRRLPGGALAPASPPGRRSPRPCRGLPIQGGLGARAAQGQRLPGHEAAGHADGARGDDGQEPPALAAGALQDDRPCRGRPSQYLVPPAAFCPTGCPDGLPRQAAPTAAAAVARPSRWRGVGEPLSTREEPRAGQPRFELEQHGESVHQLPHAGRRHVEREFHGASPAGPT